MQKGVKSIMQLNSNAIITRLSAITFSHSIGKLLNSNVQEVQEDRQGQEVHPLHWVPLVP